MRCGWLVAIFIAATAHAVPDALVVQGYLPAKKGETDANVLCSDILADEINKGGKLNPILWSIGDPIFRAAIDDGIIKNPSSKPSLGDAMKVQRILKADYMVWVEATRVGDQIKGVVTFYKGGKALWTDTQQQGLTNQGKFDPIGTLHAICHTWATLSDSGPLQKLQTSPPIPTPPPDPGKLPNQTQDPVAPPPSKPVNNTSLFDEANRLRKEGKLAQAIGALREGVDAAPMDVDRRKALVEMLLSAGEPVLAAQEARRAAQLVPEPMMFRSLAAKAWLQAGNGEEAQTDLNELAAHQPGGLDRVLNAQACLFQLKITQAIEMLDAQVAAKPSNDAYFFRSIAKALQSDEKGAVEDAMKAGDSADALRYATAMAILDNTVPKVADELRTLLDQASIKSAKELADAVSFQTTRAQATRALLQNIKPDLSHKSSHERRVLAYNLLIQCLSDLRDYMDSHNDDTLSDSRINLGEALKHFNGAKADFLAESKGSGANDRPAN